MLTTRGGKNPGKCSRLNVVVEVDFNAPPNTNEVISEMVLFTANYLTDTDT